MGSFNNTTLESYAYSLDYECPVPWPSALEDILNQDYPFVSTRDESPEDFVIRKYLETLWLPESIMPLSQLVTSLRRVRSLVSNPQSLHDVVKPMLLSVRATQDKYHQELPRILQDGGGAGELEEKMMWYAYSKEKFEADAKGETSDAEEAWKKAWMDKLEHREVQVQILLYFHLLSLPSPPPSTPVASRKKRKPSRSTPSPRKSGKSINTSTETTTTASSSHLTMSAKSLKAEIDHNLKLEDRLEFFMDKLSLWQLVASLDTSDTSQSVAKGQRDWMQVFCEEVVEPAFRDRVPELCDLLRTKVFPHSPFSDDSDEESSQLALRASTKGPPKGKRTASPLRLQELEKSKLAPSRGSSTAPTESREEPAQRPRSRSRSVSISLEEVRARGTHRGGIGSSKSIFKEEVEMKRTSSRGSKLFKVNENSKESSTVREFSRHPSRDDVLATTVPVPSSQLRSPSREPVTLAIDTPVKTVLRTNDGDNGMITESPDALLPTSGTIWDRLMDDDDEGVSHTPGTVLVSDTPVKKRAKGCVVDV